MTYTFTHCMRRTYVMLHVNKDSGYLLNSLADVTYNGLSFTNVQARNCPIYFASMAHRLKMSITKFVLKCFTMYEFLISVT